MKDFIDPVSGKPVLWLNVDEYVISDTSKIIKTILGSCVAIILFDKFTKTLAVNHYLNVDSGMPLTEKMITRMKDKGCKNIIAKVVGGANKESTHLKVGPMNIEFAKAFLPSYNIPIIEEHVGGTIGRTISVSYVEPDVKLDVKLHRE